MEAEPYHILLFCMEHPVVCGMLAGRMFHLPQQLVLQQTFTGCVFRLDELSDY